MKHLPSPGRLRRHVLHPKSSTQVFINEKIAFGAETAESCKHCRTKQEQSETAYLRQGQIVIYLFIVVNKGRMVVESALL